MRPFVVWAIKKIPFAYVLDRLHGIERQFELRKGISRQELWNPDSYYTQDMEFPDNTVQVDNFMHIDMWIVASEALKSFLEDRGVKRTEYLPIKILDHKGKIAIEKAYIIHPIDPIDCLDIDACEAEWGKIAKDSIKKIKKLQIREEKIPDDRELFRIKYYYPAILVRRELAEAIDSSGFSGIRWIELDEYQG